MFRQLLTQEANLVSRQVLRHFRTNGATACPQNVKSEASKAVTKEAEAATSAATDAAKTAAETHQPNPLTAFMFPWERAVLDAPRNEKMTGWHKLYWVAFGLSVVFIAGNRTKQYYEEEARKASPEYKEMMERKEERVKAGVHSALKGDSFISAGYGDSEDPFEGKSPEEIQAMVEEHAQDGDVFHGMSPSEINDYMEKQKKGTSQSSIMGRRL